MSTAVTGGCQCGAVRYRVHGELTNPHTCHCRMCQKAAGNYFVALAQVRKSDFKLMRGEVSWFHSSDPARRGFCSRCGTPLLLETVSSPLINVMLGSLDDPASVKPQALYGTEAAMPWIAEICAMSGGATEDDEIQEGVPLADITASNHQHPDHDTAHWPPEDRR